MAHIGQAGLQAAFAHALQALADQDAVVAVELDHVGDGAQRDEVEQRAQVGEDLHGEGQRHGRVDVNERNNLAAPVTHSNHSRYKGQYGKAVNQQHVAEFAVGGFLAGGGAVFAIVELAVGDDFIPQHVPQMPYPAFGLADNGHLAFRLELRPQLHGPPRQDEQRGEEGQHEDGVDGVVAVEHLTENNAAIGSAGEPLAAVKAGADPPHDEPQYGRNAENGFAVGQNPRIRIVFTENTQ